MKWKWLIALLFLISHVIATPVFGAENYTYGDTLKVPFALESGYYNLITSLKYYIYIDPAEAVTNTFIVSGDYTLNEDIAGDIDTSYTATWIIPSSATPTIYYFSTILNYTGNDPNLQTKTFRLGPVSATPSDTLGGLGLIDETSTDGGGDTIGPVYLPGSIPADGGEMLIYYTGTNTLAGVGTIDAAGGFDIWVDAAGTYDAEVRFQGFRAGRRTSITPTVP